MIGNDIVDLCLAKIQSNWQRKDFLEKQFTIAEQEAIAKAENPFQLVWLFWSMKEATYKCYTQQYPNRFFAPKKLQCSLISSNEGIIKIYDKEYYSFSKIHSNYIHTVASSSLKKSIVKDFLLDKKLNESTVVKQQLLSYFPEEVRLEKNKFGIPSLHQQQKLPISISLSHHGNYGGFAFQND
ncbi:4'-phosphopantetheinyl transferase superfamily protein [Polaribacter sp.]|nr:4'-phosphopantetheinyl transferase superfamily protein [Polaribacter sp.]